MRNSTLFAVALPIAVAVVSCGPSDRAAAVRDADMQRDLKLAATSTMNLAAPNVNPANFDRLETAPQSAPQNAKHLKKDAGPKAVASKSPDLKAAEIPEVATTDNVGPVETVAQAPAPIPTTDPVATVPRPSDAPRVPGRVGAGDYGGTARGGGIFGGLGPVIGVVLRGGGADGDHCEPHGQGRTPGVFMPPPGGMGGVTRFPVAPRGGGGVIHR